MSGLTGNVDFKAVLNLVNAQALSSPTDPFSYFKRFAFTPGAGANQANEMWRDQRTLAASATENLDLSGALTDAFGASVLFTKVRGIFVYAAPGNTNDVLVGGAGSNTFPLFNDVTDVAKVKPGGLFVVMAPDINGLAVTAGTGDILKVANSGAGTGITYDIAIIGS